MNNDSYKVALLIDADNVSCKFVDKIFMELNKLGDCVYRRIYGDWSKQTNGWNKDIFIKYGLSSVHQIAYASGKNSTDIRMVIDAMDILYKDNVNTFCIVSSDSDFTSLILRLREENKFVMAMGEKRTPESIVHGCNKFVYLDDDVDEQNEISCSGDQLSMDVPSMPNIDDVHKWIIDNLKDKATVSLGELGNYLHRQYPAFDVKKYGFTKLKTMIEDMSDISISNKDKVSLNCSREKVERTVISQLNNNNKYIKNMSQIHEHLKKEFGSSYLEILGYSKFKNFVKNIHGLKIEGNCIKLK